jgi:hypothetical protein
MLVAFAITNLHRCAVARFGFIADCFARKNKSLVLVNRLDD